MARVLESKSLSGLFEEDNITVFLPTSDAYFSFQYEAKDTFNLDYDNADDLRRLLLYSSVRGRYSVSDLPRAVTATLPSRLDPSLPLFINNFNTHTGELVSINGARLVKTDLQSDNGVIHVVSRMIAPVAHRSTLATYVEDPPLAHFAFTSIYFARAVVPDLTMETNRTDILFTSFSPNDSYITVMPDYGQTPLFQNWTLLRIVYLAHVVKGNALFLPEGVAPNDMESLHGVLKFSRKDNDVYVSNGRVRARVIQPNIPVQNGVLHVIDNLLYYVYRDVIQMVSSLPNTRKMSQLIQQLPPGTQSNLKQSDREFTAFIPTDFAFAKVPTSVQGRFDTDDVFLRNVVMGHIITDSNYDLDSLKLRGTLVTMNGQVLRVRVYDGELYLEWGDMRSRLVETDLGVTNGVVHLIDTVLYMNNFTVWEAMSHMLILSEIQTLTQNFNDVVDILSSDTNYVTVFLANDAAITRASKYVEALLRDSRDQVHNALLGHISLTNLTSHHIQSPVTLNTLSGSTLTVTMHPESKALYVTGSHVTAQVTVQDVWCSNGIIFIIDEILHLPTRTVGEELKRRQEFKYMTILFETLRDDTYNFSDPTRDFTVFIANNDAFSYLPWSSIDMLMRELDRTRMILRAHVVPGEQRYLADIQEGEKLQALQNVIYVVTKDDTRYVINNNIWAEVVTSDIPAVNGRVHIINRLLYIPYHSVGHLLETMTELRPFHDLMSDCVEYQVCVQSEDRNVTLFIPSSRYLRTVTSEQMLMMQTNPNILKRLYFGHALPQVRVDDVFLWQFPEENYIVSKSSYNVSFTITRTNDGVFVDGGYDRQILDVIGRAYGCTNGVIYIIDGFLNYSPFTILERLKREPSVSRSLEHMLQLPPPLDTDLLDRYNMTFTFLMPDDLAVDFLSFSDISYLHNMRSPERQKVFWRHILNGSEVTYEELRHGHLDKAILPPDVSFKISGTGLYFRYKNINSRVTRWNLVACNGIIHLITHYLYDPPSAVAPDPPLNTPTSLNARDPVKGTSGSGRLGATSFSGAAVFVFLCQLFVWTSRTHIVFALS